MGVVKILGTKRLARLAVAVAPLLLALAGCSTGGPPPEAQEGQLFAQVYRDVSRYHLAPTDADRLSLAALQALGRIDPALAIAREDGDIVLRDGGTVQRFAAPAPGDSEAWGRLTGKVVEAARATSPALAGLAPEIADERLIDGALATLDRFSRYVRPELARERRAERDGFVGVGVTLDIAANDVRIASVLPDTPAAVAGVHIADRIVAVDGTAVDALSAAAVGDRLRGPKDSTLTLELARAGSPGNLTLTLRRAIIFGETVSLEQRDGLVWLKVRGFNQRTAASAARLLRDAHQEMGDDLHGIVLDLRDNPGGLLDQSVELASLFLDGGAVSSTVGRVPDSYQSFTAPRDGPRETLPLAVLVNGGSASASEVVAAALQDRGRAVVIGSASFGKGTVQTVFRTENAGELTVTWAELVAPRGYHLHRHGVVPTVCTVALRDGSEAAATLAAMTPGPLAEPRERLDDDGWRRLRSACPPQRDQRAIDLAVAARLLATPALYQAALGPPADETPRATEAHLPR